MTDPVTNALALQMEYGDEDLKRDIDKRIEDIAKQVFTRMATNPDFMRRIIINNAYDFNKQVLRAVKEHFTNNNQIY
jgi:hypothetical protein